MPAHHAHLHQPPPIHNMDPSLGVLVPCQLPELPRHQAPPHGSAPHDPALAAREPFAELARMAAAPVAGNPSAEPARMAAAPVSQEPRAEPAPRAVGAARPIEAWDE